MSSKYVECECIDGITKTTIAYQDKSNSTSRNTIKWLQNQLRIILHLNKVDVIVVSYPFDIRDEKETNNPYTILMKELGKLPMEYIEYSRKNDTFDMYISLLKNKGVICVNNESRINELVKTSVTAKIACDAKNIWKTRDTIYNKKTGEYTFTWTPPLKNDENEYIKTLAIPPMWSPAHICKKNDKILWTAMDKKGRWQYKYSDNWKIQQEYKKIQDIQHMNKYFWNKFSKITRSDLNRPNWDKNKLQALASRLMYYCHIRPGWKEPGELEDEEDHFGLITLQKRHFDKDRLKFIGKSGKCNTCKIRSEELLKPLRDLKQMGKSDDELLFQVEELKLTINMFTSYLKKLNIKPKQFRTYHANMTFIKMIQRMEDHSTEKIRKQNLKRVYNKICKDLNNTAVITEKSYVFSGFSKMYLINPSKYFEKTDKGLSNAIKNFKDLDWRELDDDDNKTDHDCKKKIKFDKILISSNVKQNPDKIHNVLVIE